MKIIYLKIVFTKNTHQNEIMDGAEAEAVLDSVKKRDGISRAFYLSISVPAADF